MTDESPNNRRRPSPTFRSELVDKVRSAGNVWTLAEGKLVLPRVFGFCRGVERALEMLEKACLDQRYGGRQIFLLGQIIHNPWVNRHFERLGVRILSAEEIARVEEIIRPVDVAVIPAFGAGPEVQRRLAKIGCQTIDTSCGDVRRLWVWAQRAAREGYGVMIFGRANHDETVVTKSLLGECGGKYVIAGNLKEVRQLCDLLAAGAPAASFRESFGPESTNADSLGAFDRLAQVSQTTMLYEDTMKVREMIADAYARRFGAAEAPARLSFQPTVCRATQDRQAAAVELCRSGADVVVVVGGFGSSNTRHLYELARQYAPAYFIEDAGAIVSPHELSTVDVQTCAPVHIADWLPARRPLTVAILAGASTPEVVVAQVMERLGEFLGGQVVSG